MVSSPVRALACGVLMWGLIEGLIEGLIWGPTGVLLLLLIGVLLLVQTAVLG